MAWIVTATKPGMKATFRCATAALALNQLRHSQRKRYATVVVTDKAGAVVSEAQLEALIAGNDAAGNEATRISLDAH